MVLKGSKAKTQANVVGGKEETRVEIKGLGILLIGKVRKA
jgi:hypothetical protein